MKKKKAQQYSKLHLQIRKIVNDLDPEGLLKIGAPEDEYDHEVKDFIDLVESDNPILIDDIVRMWSNWFCYKCATYAKDKLSIITDKLEEIRKARK